MRDADSTGDLQGESSSKSIRYVFFLLIQWAVVSEISGFEYLGVSHRLAKGQVQRSRLNTQISISR